MMRCVWVDETKRKQQLLYTYTFTYSQAHTWCPPLDEKTFANHINNIRTYNKRLSYEIEYDRCHALRISARLIILIIFGMVS